MHRMSEMWSRSRRLGLRMVSRRIDVSSRTKSSTSRSRRITSRLGNRTTSSRRDVLHRRVPCIAKLNWSRWIVGELLMYFGPDICYLTLYCHPLVHIVHSSTVTWPTVWYATALDLNTCHDSSALGLAHGTVTTHLSSKIPLGPTQFR